MPSSDPPALASDGSVAADSHGRRGADFSSGAGVPFNFAGWPWAARRAGLVSAASRDPTPSPRAGV